MNAHEVSMALCEFLGVDPAKARAVNVKIRPQGYPIVTVQFYVRDKRAVETKRFRLVDEADANWPVGPHFDFTLYEDKPEPPPDEFKSGLHL